MARFNYPLTQDFYRVLQFEHQLKDILEELIQMVQTTSQVDLKRVIQANIDRLNLVRLQWWNDAS